MNDNAKMLRLVGQALITVADTIQSQCAPALPAPPPAAPAQPAPPPAAPAQPAPPPAAPAQPAPPPAAPAQPAPSPLLPASAAGDADRQAEAADFQALQDRIRVVADAYKQSTAQEPSPVVAMVLPRYRATKISGVARALHPSFEAELAYAFSNVPGYQQWLNQCKRPDGTVIPAAEHPWSQS